MTKDIISIGIPSKGRLRKDILKIFKKNKLNLMSERGERDLLGSIKELKNIKIQSPKSKALFEWTALSELLLKEGLTLHIYECLDKDTPDAIFPNNWFSTHRNEDGTKCLCLYLPHKSLHLENRLS